MDDLELLLPDLPEVPSVSTEGLRMQIRMSQRLPQMPGGSIDKFFMSSREAEAYEYAQALGMAYAEERARAIIMRAKARAEARLAQAIAEGRYQSLD